MRSFFAALAVATTFLSASSARANTYPCPLGVEGHNNGELWWVDCYGNESLDGGYTAWDGNPDGGPGVSISWEGIDFPDGTSLTSANFLGPDPDGGIPGPIWVIPEAADAGVAVVQISGPIIIGDGGAISVT